MTGTLRVTLVTAPDCHLCAHAKQVLARLLQARPLVVEEMAWESREGQALVRRDGVPFPPAVYINGAFFAYGRLSEGRLRRHLDGQAAT